MLTMQLNPFLGEIIVATAGKSPCSGSPSSFPNLLFGTSYVIWGTKLDSQLPFVKVPSQVPQPNFWNTHEPN